jgi:cysteine desulfuration protein SufE
MDISQQEAAAEIIDTFAMFDEWEDRYRFLIDLGKELPPFPEAEKTEINKVHGCQSNVWLIADAEDEGAAINFIADSDAHIVRGLIAILRRIYAHRSAQEILEFDISKLMQEIGLDQHLSTGRRNGLAGMVARIKHLAGELSSAPAA